MSHLLFLLLLVFAVRSVFCLFHSLLFIYWLACFGLLFARIFHYVFVVFHLISIFDFIFRLQSSWWILFHELHEILLCDLHFLYLSNALGMCFERIVSITNLSETETEPNRNDKLNDTFSYSHRIRLVCCRHRCCCCCSFYFLQRSN